MKRGQQIDWKARLEQLEADVKEIKARLQSQQPKEPWWESIVGSFADDPVFEEISELGRKIRNEELEIVVRKKKKRKTRNT